MDFDRNTDLSRQVRVCSTKLVDGYSTILRKTQLPQKQGLENALQPLSINLSSESIFSSCRILLDVIQEVRVRKLVCEMAQENR